MRSLPREPPPAFRPRYFAGRMFRLRSILLDALEMESNDVRAPRATLAFVRRNQVQTLVAVHNASPDLLLRQLPADSYRKTSLHVDRKRRVPPRRHMLIGDLDTRAIATFARIGDEAAEELIVVIPSGQ